MSYFDPRADTHVQVDASRHGIGVVLLQNGILIAFASKSLSDCEVAMLTSSERCWQSYSVVSVFTRMCMGSDLQFSRITNRWK